MRFINYDLKLSMYYRAVIAEDRSEEYEENFFQLLQKAFSDEIEVVGLSENIEDLIEVIEKLKPDLVFISVDLKDRLEFEIFERLKFKGFHLVFISSNQKDALKAFKFGAVDCLLKPVSVIDIKESIERIGVLSERILEKAKNDGSLLNLRQLSERLILPTQEATYIVNISDLIRCETSGSYTTFFTADQRKIIVSKPLKSYEHLLKLPNFVRVHRSHAVNLDYIISFSKEGYLLLKDKTLIPISNRKKDLFLRSLK